MFIVFIYQLSLSFNHFVFQVIMYIFIYIYRIAITLVSDPGANLQWKDVREVVIGRIRNTREYRPNEHGDMSVLSLNLLPGQLMTMPLDERLVG